MGWGVSVTPRLPSTPGKDPVPIVQEARWAPGPVWTGAENLAPTGFRSPDRAVRSQSLYRLSYPAHWYRSTSKKYKSVVSSIFLSTVCCITDCLLYKPLWLFLPCYGPIHSTPTFSSVCYQVFCVFFLLEVWRGEVSTAVTWRSWRVVIRNYLCNC
jgi:hypothetical protein